MVRVYSFWYGRIRKTVNGKKQDFSSVAEALEHPKVKAAIAHNKKVGIGTYNKFRDKDGIYIKV